MGGKIGKVAICKEERYTVLVPGLAVKGKDGGKSMQILVTGGAGYIGSHTVLALLKEGHAVTVVDNLSNSSEKSVQRVEKLAGKKLHFVKVDIRDRAALEEIFSQKVYDCCMHFAGLKAVGESVTHPLEYYENNIGGTMVLLDVMRKYGCKNIIFSSSATVYGAAEKMPITEETPRGNCTNPYGKTKAMLEEILTDMHTADVVKGEKNPWNVVLLRYFNPIGADASGLIGEDPEGIPNNLLPYITQVAVGKRACLTVNGNDYDTHDGTGVRDYIHVVDLARGHVCALKAIERNCGVAVYNLGLGKGYSVLDVVKTFEEVNGLHIPYVIGPRRAGDIAACYSDPGKANRELGWKAMYDLKDMCKDSWNWQRKNPNGYRDEGKI